MWEVGGIKIERTRAYKKMTKLRLSAMFFGVFLVISEFGSPDNIEVVVVSDFQNLSVLGDFYALYHFLCQRYTKY